jgi:hypothetical protein
MSRFLALLLACWTAGCVAWTPLERPWTEARIAPEKQLRVRWRDAPSVVVLTDVHVTTQGGREYLTGRNAEPPCETGEIALDLVATIDVERRDALGTVTLILVIAIVVGGLVFAEYTPSEGAFYF